MRLTFLFAPLLVASAVALPNAKPEANNDNGCFSYTVPKVASGAEAQADQVSTKQCDGHCTYDPRGIPNYIIQGGYVCDFFSNGCDKNPQLGSFVREVSGKQHGAAGYLPNSVKYFACRHQ